MEAGEPGIGTELTTAAGEDARAAMLELLRKADPEVYSAVKGELNRQRHELDLIASENYTSEAVFQAAGCVMTNKYAEGYPGSRFYEGCAFVDQAERIARQRAKDLFQAEHANVQPHAGTQANMAVYFAALNPGDTVLGMDLAHGGHLSHGSPYNFSGRLYNCLFYGVDPDTEMLDMDEVARIARKTKPRMIIAGASAYSRTIDFEAFGRIAQGVGAYLLADIAHIAGLVVAGMHPSPVPHADFVTATVHKTMRGPRGGIILCRQKWANRVDKQIIPGIQGGPLMHQIAAKAVALKEAMSPEFKDYQAQVVRNCKHLAGLIAGYGYRIVSGGTDNHLFMVDLRPQEITGRRAASQLARAGIIVNKNVIPFDPSPPAVTSGIRIGTPACTTRGMGEPEMQFIAELIHRVLTNINDDDVAQKTKFEIRELCDRFPIYENVSRIAT